MDDVTYCLGFRNWNLPHLERCLHSLRASTDSDIVVCDLGSEPKVADGVRRLCTQSTVGASLIEIATATEWSRSQALNRAAALARTRWLVFTDADMLFPPSWFNQMSAHVGLTGTGTLHLTRSRDLDATATAALNSPTRRRLLPGDWETWLLTHSQPHNNDLGQGAAMIVPQAWFHQVGGFDEFYQVWGCEDNDLTMRAAWDGLRVEWLPHAFVVHQWHPRDWPTPAQFARVNTNRAYLRERLQAGGPVVRNQRRPQ